MFRKAFFLGGGLLLVGGLIFGRDFCSYVSTTGGWVSDSVKNNVPVEFEINRAKTMINDLRSPIRDSMHAIAKEEASVERLAADIEKREDALDQSRKHVLRLKDDLSSGGSEFYYAGHRYTTRQVQTDLAARFANHKTNEATLSSLRQILQARKSGLDAAREKLVEMQSAKRQLEVDVENLQARLKMVEVAQTASQLTLDDSELSRVRELVGDLNARVDVLAKLASADSFPGAIPLDVETAPDDIVDEVASYFDGGAPKAIETVAHDESH
jgi:chromosome segregation ATPase